jgi:type IV pilus assembly protein PilM
MAERAGLHLLAVDPEPLALLRSYARQQRRDEDQQRRILFVNIGASSSLAVISRGMEAVFVKYMDIGGRMLDEAVSARLQISPADAASLRRLNSDRAEADRDAEIARAVAESIRPMLDRLVHELSLCIRYHSVTFRGESLEKCILGGGEADQALADWLGARLELPCELGNPLRSFENERPHERISQWDVAAGLALREPCRH